MFMKTWTYDKESVTVIITADNVETAIQILKRDHNIEARPTDLIPCPTHHRYSRVLASRLDFTLIKQKDAILQLITNCKYREARACLKVLEELWISQGYEYKLKEIRTAISQIRHRED